MAFPICTELLVKLSARCNMACPYCYWFRDESVLTAKHRLTEPVVAALLEKLTRHLQHYQLTEFSIVFHGGEPLLYGKQRFATLCAGLRQVAQQTGCQLKLSVQTNGLLIDQAWCELLQQYQIAIGISLDGTQVLHDKNRIDLNQQGTYQKVLSAINLLRKNHLDFGVLAVCAPELEPDIITEHFINDLHINKFDILQPAYTHDDKPIPSISTYYVKLFDLWLTRYLADGVQIRYLESIVKGLLGKNSGSQSIGYGAIATASLNTDGSLEALDSVRIAGTGFNQSTLNILSNEIQHIEQNPLWQALLQASINLPPSCQSCEFNQVCGGGDIATRYSSANGFNNPSVYCADLKHILSHAQQQIQQLFAEPPTLELTHSLNG
jgi:uncharacterized protein